MHRPVIMLLIIWMLIKGVSYVTETCDSSPEVDGIVAVTVYLPIHTVSPQCLREILFLCFVLIRSKSNGSMSHAPRRR
ncbi:MAG TPA: hypothetical protein VGL38_14430 [bacterium]